MRAAPLLRAWLHRLRDGGVRFHVRHRWHGWRGDGALQFVTPQGQRTAHADAVVLALGGGSWPQLGSDGAWVPFLAKRGVAVSSLPPLELRVRCRLERTLSCALQRRSVKTVVATFTHLDGHASRQQGEFIVTQTGVEGGLIYALSAPLREHIAVADAAILYLDLAPGWELPRLVSELSRPRGSRPCPAISRAA